MRLPSSLLTLLVSLGLLAACSDREPFYGAHQAGIATGPQQFAFVAAFDLTTTDPAEVRTLLKDWTRASEALTQGKPLGADTSLSVPASDTGEVLGKSPSRLTFTFGVGPSLFDGRFGLAGRRPPALVPLPPFAGDNLNPGWSDGDLVVQVAGDDYQTVYHGLHTLTRAAQGRAVVRWLQDGFQGPRNLEGFLDGTVNPDPRKPEDMARVVWAQGPDWMDGGSYLVVRRIRMLVEVWDRSSLGDQQRTVGRDRAEGKELSTQAPDSHVALARGTGVEKILRRPFHYVNGIDGRTGQWDSGLLFLAWMKDPGLQFVPMQTRLSSHDRLNEYIQPVGSAVFAVFPGIQPGSYVGDALFPEAPLAGRIESLQAALGGLFPAVSQGDWARVREGAGEWNRLWSKEREAAGPRAAGLDALRDAWALTLEPEVPDAKAVRAAQAALVGGLEDWGKGVKPRTTETVTDLRALKDRLAEVRRALAVPDAPGARQAFAGFQKEWSAREALVRGLDQGVYGDSEVLISQLRLALGAEPPTGAGPVADALQAKLGGLRPPAAFGAWDAGFLLFREGLEALLVLAALLAFLAKTGQGSRAPWVWAGAGTGLGASVAAAAGISLLMTGWMAAAAPELIEGLTGMAAVALMLTVGLWLHGKATIKNWNLWVKEKIGKAAGRPWALGALAFIAVLREGAETAVFFWGLAGSLSMGDLFLGVAGALVVLAVLGVALIGFSKRLPLQWFFPLATGLIYLLAVKILGQSLASLQSAGWLTSTSLGWGGVVGWAGFSPTWETAVPQGVLFVVLAAMVAFPLVKNRPKKAAV